MADKKISQLTEKETLVENDIITILDSEDNNTNKKAKISAIPIVNNLKELTVTGTFTSGVLTFTASETFTPVDGDLYKFKAPIGNTTNATAFNLIIGETTYPIYFVVSSYAIASVNLITAGDIIILVYNSTDSCFYVTYNSTASAGFQRVGDTLIRSAYSILPDAQDKNLGSVSSRWGAVYSTQTYASGVPLYQGYATNTSTTPSVGTTTNQVTVFTNPLESLTITAIPTSTIECEYQFTAGENFTLTATPLENKWLGVDEPTFTEGESYVIKIKNGYAISYKVGA